ncbi:MAG: DUF2490 domain-containing protein [Acidobacteriia bacterium]|nr:DUF2490 domain-containing protein [Terriglobia bacterium]
MPVLAATELYSWHLFDVQTKINKSFEIILHSRIRTRDEFHQVQQLRTGAILLWHPKNMKLTPIFGYYYQPVKEKNIPWRDGHRVFAGLMRPFPLPERMVLNTRIAVERHMYDGVPGYMRYRTYVRLEIPKGKITPFVQNEWLAVKTGFHSVRNSGGIRFQLSPNTILETGYLYDIRRTVYGGDRSAIVTTFRYTIPER